MKPDDVVNILKDEWGLSLTRRTVLTYEKDGLAAPPFIETGKYKEYPPTTLAEIIASWCLIHGEYGLRPKKVVEIRERALKIIYDFGEIWREELDNPDDIKNICDLIKKNISWQIPGDFFAFNWLMIRMNVLYAKNNKAKESMKNFIITGDFNQIPGISVSVIYNVYNNDFSIPSVDVGRNIEKNKSKGTIKIHLKGFSGSNPPYGNIYIEYLHPEDYAIARPVMP